MLRGLALDEFAIKLAEHYKAFNYIHPFRDGNGRVQRLFWDRVSRDAGWAVDWSQVDGETNGRLTREASRPGMGQRRSSVPHAVVGIATRNWLGSTGLTGMRRPRLRKHRLSCRILWQSRKTKGKREIEINMTTTEVKGRTVRSETSAMTTVTGSVVQYLASPLFTSSTPCPAPCDEEEAAGECPGKIRMPAGWKSTRGAKNSPHVT